MCEYIKERLTSINECNYANITFSIANIHGAILKLNTKETYTTILKLVKSQYWLDCRESYNALVSLFNECLNRDELKLITELISLFMYTNPSDFFPFYKEQALRLAESYEISDGELRINYGSQVLIFRLD